jgi:Spy/CpxP family protein refolding chaperone
MKPTYKLAAGVIASLGLGIAVATAYANPGQMGGGMEHGKGGMQHGAQGGMQHGGMGGGAGHGAGQQLMTPEERTALQEKMRNAKTPEERQQIATATRTEMEKRAKEKGITLPEHSGPHFGGTRQAPATN